MRNTKIHWGKWNNYWEQYENLDSLNQAYDHLDRVFNEIESVTGRILLSADMVGIQESLINRIELLSNPQVQRPNMAQMTQFSIFD